MENPWFTDVSIVDEREHYPELGYWINKRRMKLQLHNLFLEKKEVNRVMSDVSTQKYKGLIASALKKVMVVMWTETLRNQLGSA